MLQDTQAELDDLRAKIRVLEKGKAALTDDCREISDAMQRSNVALGSLSSKVEDVQLNIATLQRRCDVANAQAEEAQSAFNVAPGRLGVHVATGRLGAAEQYAQESSRVCSSLDDRLAILGTSQDPSKVDQEQVVPDDSPPSLQGALEETFSGSGS